VTTRILLAEDEAIVALDERTTLERLGYQVVDQVATGALAVEGARRHRPDLVLMDIKLQGDMDGIEAARTIREEHDIPVMFVTAHSDDRCLARAREAHPSGFVLKPFTESTLRSNIEIALYRHEVRTELERSEQHLRQVTASLAEGLLVLSRSGRLTHMNREAERLLGWSEAELRTMALPELLAAIGQAPEGDRSFADALRCGAARRNHEEVFVRRGGAPFPVSANISPLGGEGGPDGVVVTFQDISERKRQEEELVRLATRDSLTGLYNRSELLRILRAELERALRYRRPLSMCLLDIDDFKRINDTWGHAAGDQVLRQFAERLQRVMRGCDSVGRYGGEEFVVVMPETDREEALALSRRLVREIAESALVTVEGCAVGVTVSVGVAYCPEDGADVDGLLGAADRAMYAAKRGGKNRVSSERGPGARDRGSA
jgi:diguanylate cyclase (GGDEF)-like protein/PAS domain S-box-containing protein